MHACIFWVAAQVPQPVPFRGKVAVAAPSRAAAIEKPSAVPDQEQVAAFMNVVSPHLRAAYGLARSLLGNDHDAEDAAQDAYVRAFRHFDGWNGVNARAWLLTIVRRCCYTFLAQNRAGEIGTYDEEQHSANDEATELRGRLEGPERAALRADDARLLNRAVAALPVEYREVFVLREIEGLSYKEIADVAGVPIGTVMSRLSRARTQLQKALRAEGETP